MKALFDGDMLVFMLCRAVEEWSPFDKTVLLSADPEKTWSVIQMRVDQCCEIIDEHFGKECDPVIVFSHKDNYRKVVNPSYKSNRTGEKPVLYERMVKKCHTHYVSEEWANLEADDVMGIMQDEESVIVTGDKDLLQITGYHLSLRDPEAGVITITPAEGMKLFHTQCLSGDSVDGYYGCPSIGKVKATKIVEACRGSMWSDIVSTYQSAMSPKSKTIVNDSGSKRTVKLVSKNLGLGESDALLTARMAYILRDEKDYNKETGEVNLWTPV